MVNAELEFLPFSPELAAHFKTINQQWIEQMFEMEATDYEVLGDPQRHIIDTGGQIWFARHPELGVVGACALMNQGDGVFELTKMGVLPKARGLKVGEALLRRVLEEARQMDMSCLYLLTNHQCEAAIHLYEKLGFLHDEMIMARFGEEYQRCDVAMRYGAL